MAPQWLRPPPAYQSPELQDLVANYFPAIVPTHLYSAQDYRRDPVNNFRGAIEMKATFEFPLHRVDETNDLGFVLVVDNLWPDLHNSWFDLSKDMRSQIFQPVHNIRAEEDGKLVIICKIRNPNVASYEFDPRVFFRVLHQPWDVYFELNYNKLHNLQMIGQ